MHASCGRSAAYRLLHKTEYLEIATRAKREIIDRFYDTQFGGVYWSIDAHGQPLDTKKQVYAIGFAIYGLSEYHRATADDEALEYAVRLFHDIVLTKEKMGIMKRFPENGEK